MKGTFVKENYATTVLEAKLVRKKHVINDNNKFSKKQRECFKNGPFHNVNIIQCLGNTCKIQQLTTCAFTIVSEILGVSVESTWIT